MPEHHKPTTPSTPSPLRGEGWGEGESRARLIFVSAGEASGDARAAEVIREAKRLDPSLQFFGLGGPLMEAEGVELLTDMTKIAHLGLGDVLKNYFQYRHIFYSSLREIARRKPQALFLVDYPGFNLRLAKKNAKRIPVLYYVSPQVWAWGKRRVKTIERVVDKMLLLFEFEKAVYRRTKLETEVVGHPLAGRVNPSASREELRKEFGLNPQKKLIALLPGSREKEIRRILPAMLSSGALMLTAEKDLEFVLSEAPNLKRSLFDEMLRLAPLPVKRITGRSIDIAAASDFALVTSGTATLETALTGCPFFILYKAGELTYQLAKRLIQLPYIGLVNVISGKMVIPEFLQEEMHPESIAHEALFLLKDADARRVMEKHLHEVKHKLGEPGAHLRAAKSLLAFLAKHAS